MYTSKDGFSIWFQLIKGFIQPNVVDQNTGDIFYGIFIKQDICGIVI